MGISEDIANFENVLKELVVRYEQYFLGLEKREPLQMLAEVEKMARMYTPANITNTMFKFRYNATVARLSSYKQYWNRINRLIEEGKYSRDRFKMELHMKNSGEREAPLPKKKKTEAEALYEKFIEARQACKLPTHNITPDMIAGLIEQQKPVIAQKYRCQQVEFQVVIEAGKPKIKARPK